MKGSGRFTVAIDRGNSYVKATLLEEGRPAGRIRSAGLDQSMLRSLCGDNDISAVILSSVGSASPDLVGMLCSVFGVPVLEMDHSTPLPIEIDYRTPDTLGLDRIAAAVGAKALFPGEAVLVADAGTALTLDVVDSDGRFRGGDISPGVKLRLRSLHEYTDRLPEVDKIGDVPWFGYDTCTALRCGAIRGAASEVAGAFLRCRRLYGSSRVILTGGDGGILEAFVRESLPIGTDLETIGDLVAVGLHHILLYNEHNLRESSGEDFRMDFRECCE